MCREYTNIRVLKDYSFHKNCSVKLETIRRNTERKHRRCRVKQKTRGANTRLSRQHLPTEVPNPSDLSYTTDYMSNILPTLHQRMCKLAALCYVAGYNQQASRLLDIIICAVNIRAANVTIYPRPA